MPERITKSQNQIQIKKKIRYNKRTRNISTSKKKKKQIKRHGNKKKKKIETLIRRKETENMMALPGKKKELMLQKEKPGWIGRRNE